MAETYEQYMTGRFPSIRDPAPDELFCDWNITFIDDDLTKTPQREGIQMPCKFVKVNTDARSYYRGRREIFPRQTWFKMKMNMSYCGILSSFSFNFFQNRSEYSTTFSTVEPVLKDEINSFRTTQRQLSSLPHEYDKLETVAFTDSHEHSYEYKFTYLIVEEKHVKYICGFYVEIPTGVIYNYFRNFFGSIEQKSQYTFK